MRRRDQLLARLAGELAASREREGVLRERLAWFEASMPPQALRLADAAGSGAAFAGQAPRRSAARSAARLTSR